MCSYSTRRRRIRNYEKELEEYKSSTLQFQRMLGFDQYNQIYFVIDTLYNQNATIRNKEYFCSFDEFAKYVDYDFCGADFSSAPLDADSILKHKTDCKTKLPLPRKYEVYELKKKYVEDKFMVEQKWFDSAGKEILNKEHDFKRFFDYVHFLKGDLSESDFLFCDGIENIASMTGLDLTGIQVRSDIAEKLGLSIKLIPENKYVIKEFDAPAKYELETVESLLAEHPEDDDYSGKISYITDIHLLHRFDAYKCKTQDDINYVIKTITKTIGDQATDINLIGGDTSSDFDVFKSFITNLSLCNRGRHFFFVLGNHELWGMGGDSLYTIIQKFGDVLEQNGKGNMHLVQNNLFYSDYGRNEITEDELFHLSQEEIRAKTRSAKLIIFGGIGFAGMSEEFNANDGIYKNVLNRDGEIIESTKFLTLYRKVTEALKGRNLIVLTHMPMKDWGGVDMHAKEGVVYVNGHSHRNYFYDDGKKRIYADNQIGYRGKRLSLKQFSINLNFDWFEDYKDGIYEINKEDYENFYRGVGEWITFNRSYEKLFMLKRENTYMFLMQTPKGKMQILNGGSIRNANEHSIEYFYDNLVRYSKSVQLFLSKYDAYQKQVSSELKKIGASGTIHGSIVDINFYNHVYINPLDWTITPYFARSMVDKYVYDNLPSLLKYECPEIYNNYQQLIEQKENTTNALIIRGLDLPLSKNNTYVDSTEMYKVSRIIKGLQFTTKYNIVRLWNDAIVANATEENGRLIVSSIINPKSLPEPIVKDKHRAISIKENKPKIEKTILSKEEKNKIRDKKYKDEIALETHGDISCIVYRGSKEKADYKCNVCGYKWSNRPDHFKSRQLCQCPSCSKNRTETLFIHDNSSENNRTKNEVIDSIILLIIKNNNGLLSKQELYKYFLNAENPTIFIAKSAFIRSITRLKEKKLVMITSGKIFITDEGIKSTN